MTSSEINLLAGGGCIADMRELGVIESCKLKRALISSAGEAADEFALKLEAREEIHLRLTQYLCLFSPRSRSFNLRNHVRMIVTI